MYGMYVCRVMYVCRLTSVVSKAAAVANYSGNILLPDGYPDDRIFNLLNFKIIFSI